MFPEGENLVGWGWGGRVKKNSASRSLDLILILLILLRPLTLAPGCCWGAPEHIFVPDMQDFPSLAVTPSMAHRASRRLQGWPSPSVGLGTLKVGPHSVSQTSCGSWPAAGWGEWQRPLTGPGA